MKRQRCPFCVERELLVAELAAARTAAARAGVDAVMARGPRRADAAVKTLWRAWDAEDIAESRLEAWDCQAAARCIHRLSAAG